jgi:hypothetical protein
MRFFTSTFGFWIRLYNGIEKVCTEIAIKLKIDGY